MAVVVVVVAHSAVFEAAGSFTALFLPELSGFNLLCPLFLSL